MKGVRNMETKVMIKSKKLIIEIDINPYAWKDGDIVTVTPYGNNLCIMKKGDL